MSVYIKSLFDSMKLGIFKSILKRVKLNLVNWVYVFFFVIAGFLIYCIKFTNCRIGISRNADEINEVLVNLSYSYMVRSNL